MIDRQVSLLGAPDAAIGQPQVKGKGIQAMQLNLTADVIEELLDCIRSGKTPQILLGNSPVRFLKCLNFSVLAVCKTLFEYEPC
jgi:hypothetical protein